MQTLLIAVAFSADSDEGRFEYMDDEIGMIELFGSIDHKVSKVDSETDFTKLAFSRTAKIDLFVPLLLLAMVCFGVRRCWLIRLYL